MTKVRCRNWKGSGKVSYADISSLESHFNKGELFSFISATGNNDVVVSTEFYREDEKKDERLNDPGAEARKKELLCQRAAEHNSGISSGMKTFIEVGKDSASEIPCPSATMGKSSQSLCPAATKEKGKGKVEESVVPPMVRRSPRQGRKAKEIEDLRSSLKKTMDEAVIEHKKSGDVGLIGSILTILCLCSKFD
ncbi:hypothetical protein Bca101_087195 [Brassica carinata]